MTLRRFLFFPLCLFILGARSRPASADFKIHDAIEEFGERRYLRPLPARIKAGPLRVHPLLQTSATFDDNILRENQDAKRDIVFNIQPGVILDLPVKRHQFSLGYQADFEVFSKPRDSRQNSQNQNVFSLIDLNFPDWYINVLERYAETSTRAGTTFTERIPRRDQSINPKIGYKWRRLTFETGFRHFDRDFRQQVFDSFDFQMVEWTNVIFYDFFANLKMLLEHQWAQIDYDDAEDRPGTFNQLRIGLEGKLLPNLTAKIRVGPQFRNYRKSSEPDFYSWVGKATVDYQVRPRLKLYTGLSREAVEATFQSVNFYREHLIYFGFEYQIRPTWTLFSEARYYRHDYAERATVSGSTMFRRDQHAGAKTGVRYDFREWLEFELAYEYLHRSSNFDTFEFNEHTVSLTTALAY